MGANDTSISHKFIEAGASDIVFQADINEKNLQNIIQRHTLKGFAQDALNEIRTGSKIPKL